MLGSITKDILFILQDLKFHWFSNILASMYHDLNKNIGTCTCLSSAVDIFICFGILVSWYLETFYRRYTTKQFLLVDDTCQMVLVF